MCGIVGLIGGKIPEGLWGDAYALTRNLYLGCEHRGRDATGYVARTLPYDSPASSTTLVAKQPLTASRFVETPEFTRLAHRRCSSFVGHCRAATHGTPKDNRNNHPFVSDDGLLALVHNGVITNVEDLQDEYLFDLNSQCDSEAILRIVERGHDVPSGLTRAMKDVRGAMAVAVYDQRSDCCWLASNGGRPLWLAHLPKLRCWVFASTDAIILNAIKQTFGKNITGKLDFLAPVADHVPLALTPTGLVYAPASR